MIIGVIIAAVVVSGALVVYARARAVTPPPSTPAPALVPESPEGSTPRFGSRRWARMLYHNGLIDLAELNAFYAQHPEKLNDPDR